MTSALSMAPSSAGLLAHDNAKYARQDELYAFPYHHLPHRDARGGLSVARSLSWGAEYLCYLEHVAALVRALRPQRVLDAGCGDGRFFTLLAADEVPQRVGIDLSERAIAYARAFTPSATWYTGSIGDLTECFDVVTAIEVMEHVPDQAIQPFVSSLVDRLEIGGRAVVTVPSTVLPLNAKHHRHYDEPLLRTHLGTDPRWRVLEVQHVIRDGAFPLQVMRLLQNRWWSLDVVAWRRWLWKSLWQHARLAGPGTGRHLVAVLERTR